MLKFLVCLHKEFFFRKVMIKFSIVLVSVFCFSAFAMEQSDEIDDLSFFEYNHRRAHKKTFSHNVKKRYKQISLIAKQAESLRLWITSKIFSLLRLEVSGTVRHQSIEDSDTAPVVALHEWSELIDD